MAITQEKVRERFKHHPPRNDNEIKMHEFIRDRFVNVALHLMETLPEQVVQTREFAQVLTDLENGMMHCNQAYALNKPVEPRTAKGSLD